MITTTGRYNDVKSTTGTLSPTSFIASYVASVAGERTQFPFQVNIKLIS